MIVKPQDYLVRIRPRPDTLYVSQGRTVLATDRDGFIRNGADHGFLVHETRLLSRYLYLVNGRVPQPVALSNVEQHTWLGYYIIEPPGVEPEEKDQGSGQMDAVSQQTLELRLSRYAGDGLHEDVDLTNFARQKIRFTLTLELDADFADIDETKGKRWQNGEMKREWQNCDEALELQFDYRADHTYSHQGNTGTSHLHRGLKIRVENSTSAPINQSGHISFAVELEPSDSWHACINLIPLVDGHILKPLYGCRSFGFVNNDHDRRRQIFFGEATEFIAPQTETLTHIVTGALEQAKKDLASLRLYDLDLNERAWTMAAGLPIYIALFGRDVLTAAWQAGLLSPDLMKGTLPELARWQGTEENAWRDEQPGKLIHEAHDGPTKVLNYNPRGRYYGSITTSGFYPVAVSELWHWTGDRDLVKPLLEPAMKALKWLEEYGDLDGDGFYEYRTASEQGVKHQAWKDSPDAIVYEDGTPVDPPIATCEEQGFAYLAKLHMSELLWWFDYKVEAKKLFQEAEDLKKRFNEAFWMEDEGFFAMGLDAEKRQIKSVGSNPGHCMATAIVDEALVPRTALRFIEDDLFSGWGVRTLSSAHPAYNPYSYHRGSVWPVEQGTFALAFMRYGYHRVVELIAQAQFEAAALFDFYRLPEVFSGHARDVDHPYPALYPQANSPQAWSASTTFCLLQAMLGLYPYAPLNMLLVDPHLPKWLPEITLKNLQIGEAKVTIRFYRLKNGKSEYRVLEKRGHLHILRQPSPWSLTAGFGERLKDALMSLLPGK